MIKPDRHWRWRRGVSNRSAAARADGAGASAGAPTRKQNKTKLKPSPPPPLSQAVDGSRRVASPYTLAFRKDAPNPTHLCARTLSLSEVASLRDAVLGDWYFQFLVDGLPVYGYLGKAVPPPADAPPGTPPTATLFTRLHFELAANGDRVVEATASADQASAVALPPPPAPGTAEAPLTLTFTYTVAWTESTTPPARRMDRYARETFLPHHLDVHWFSILNSGVTALLLTGFLATILARVLRADVRRYGAAGGLLVDGGELGSGGGGGGGSGSGSGFLHHQHSYGGGGAIAADEDDDAGWKALHADVFRFPPAKASFCAAIGTGAQLLAAASALFAASLFGAFRPHARGAVAAAGLGLYAATAGVAGYVGGSYYRQLGGRAWVRCTLATAGALGGPLFAVFCVNNSVALAYKVRFVFFVWEGGDFFFSRARAHPLLRPPLPLRFSRARACACPALSPSSLPLSPSLPHTQSTAALPASAIASLVALWAVVTLPLTVAGAVVGKHARPEFYAPVRTAKFPREVCEWRETGGCGACARARAVTPFLLLTPRPLSPRSPSFPSLIRSRPSPGGGAPCPRSPPRAPSPSPPSISSCTTSSCPCGATSPSPSGPSWPPCLPSCWS